MQVNALVNQKDTVALMFHTAANTVSLTKKALERVKTLNFGQATESESWGGRGTIRNSINNTLQIENFQWDSVVIWETRHSGHETDGKFGPDLFKDKVIEIDFERRRLVVHTTLPQNMATYQAYKLKMQHGFMFMEGRSAVAGGIYNHQFLIHSGYSGALLFDDTFVEKRELGKHLKVIKESELKDAAGNILKTKKAILPSFIIGETQLSDLPIGFFEGAIGRQKMSVLGGDILKRFHLIFDLKQAYLYLKPNALLSLPYTST